VAFMSRVHSISPDLISVSSDSRCYG
jgi:hypothetical protein